MPTDRRRNAYPGTCRVCGTDVPAGAGWLYSDTSRKLARRPTRAWPKFVKCDRCHTLKAVRKTDLPEHRPAPPRKLSVAEIRAGRLVPACQRRPGVGCIDLVVLLVLADGTSGPVAGLIPITGGISGLGDRPDTFAGCDLTHGAAEELFRLSWVAADIFEPFFNDGYTPRTED